MKKLHTNTWLAMFTCTLALSLNAQNDSIFLRKIHDEALVRGKSYESLRSLCKDVGARLSGSTAAAMAVEWSEKLMNSYGFDKVYKEEIMVPHWERGTVEKAWVKGKNVFQKMTILALGGSIATNGKLEAKMIEFKSLEALQKANKKDVEGKIVFLNQEMDQAFIQTFKAYGACGAIRHNGAVEAAKQGAIGIVIRSLAIPIDDFPHTGSMHYEADVNKIPAAAMSTTDCEWLTKELSQNKDLSFVLELNCQNYPDIKSYNIIAEMTGTENPKEVITFGGHIDSWDAGEGAHDDGAGVMHSLEALRILKTLQYKPKHTLRCVFFMNEENGNMGGKTYADWTKERGDLQIAAIESDRGGFSPRGFDVDGNDAQLALLRTFAPLLKPYDLLHLEKGWGGVDIGPLKKTYEGIPLFGLVTDSQRYFDFHHADSDVFENVNKRELELGAAAMASLVYLLDKNL